MASVPQGTVITSLLFDIFISVQPTLPITVVGDFIDYKAIIANTNDSKTTSSHVQDHLVLLQTLYREWDVKINKSKSKHYTFTLRKELCLPLHIHDKTITTDKYVRYIGIQLDQPLTWSPHLRHKP